MTPLTLPQARVPFGWADVAGARTPVLIDLEWMRALSTLVDRAGGVTGDASFEDVAPVLLGAPGTSPEVQDALRAVDELRNELAGARSDIGALRSMVDELTAQLGQQPAAPDLTGRVQQIEDRLQ